MGASRGIKIDATLAGLDGPAVVHAVRGREEVSRAFRYQIDLEAPEIRVEEIRGSTALLALEDEAGRVRHLSGVVFRLEQLASDGAAGRFRYRLHLVPSTYLLSLRHGFRIFQELSAPDVVRTVVEHAGLSRRLRFELAGSYPERAFCVQYDETEWDFLCRLLEEEGIWFRFDQTAEGNAMVVADVSGTSARPEGGASSLAFVADPALHGTALRAWGVVQGSRASVGKAVVGDYDFSRPSLDLECDASAADGHGTSFEYPARAFAKADTRRLARSRLEELRSRRRTIRFATNALALQAGQRVEITDHPSASGEYFVTAISLHVRLEQENATTPLVEAGEVEGWLEVEAVPADQPFRPARVTPRPRVPGPQTARVTGPAGEEIHCDEHGRVKLQFHWDRDGKLDDKSSAWIRVAQPHTTGSVTIPRMGWEVLVDFLEGDPDRPVCTGRLFNTLFPPSYDLPAQKTVTAHRSNSSPGAAGANELRFDDAPGTQQVLLNAQRDLQIVAAEKKTVRVGKEQSLTIGASNHEKVSAGEEISVKGSESRGIGGAQTISAGTRKIEVNGAAAEEVKGSYTLQVSGIEMVKVGNPVQALVQLAATEAINQVAALAGAAANNATQALVAPLKPALDAIGKAAGSLPRLPGPVAGLLGKDPCGALPIPQEASKALALADPKALGDAVGSAVTGAAASAAPAAAEAIAKAMGGGSGTAGLTVGGDLDVRIGAVEVVNAVGGIALGVGGASKETVGAARLELAGGRSETTGGNKIETIGGAYVVTAGEAIAIDAGANIALTVGAVMKQKIEGAHGMSAKGAAGLMTSRLKLEANEKITLKCGLSEVVIGSDGISLKGLDVTVEGSNIQLTPPAIRPG
ncbi:MAG: type VI secretion system Vgr family protein [Myxococcales bacterium]